jgi:DNA-binding IclR family transcriptional regulator
MEATRRTKGNDLVQRVCGILSVKARERQCLGRSCLSAITRYLEILLFVAQSSEPVSAGAVAAGTAASRTTAYRILDDLCRDGWLRASGSPRRFSPSFRLAEIGIAVLRQNRVRDVLLPHAIELARSTQHFCYVSFYEDGEVIHTDQVVLIAERIFASLSGVRLPAPTAASGKILLAYQPPEEVERVLTRKIEKRASRTKTDPAEIHKDLALCRERGYGLSDRELSEHTVGVAVPVFNAKGQAVASLSVNVLQPTEGNVADLARQATNVAMRASMELGFRPPVVATPM